MNTPNVDRDIHNIANHLVQLVENNWQEWELEEVQDIDPYKWAVKALTTFVKNRNLMKTRI